MEEPGGLLFFFFFPECTEAILERAINRGLEVGRMFWDGEIELGMCKWEAVQLLRERWRNVEQELKVEAKHHEETGWVKDWNTLSDLQMQKWVASAWGVPIQLWNRNEVNRNSGYERN